MDVKVESSTTLGSGQARKVGVIGLVEVLLLVGLVVAVILLLPKIRTISQPVAAVPDFQKANPEVRQAQRYMAAASTSPIMDRDLAALNPELAAVQSFAATKQEGLRARWQATNPELRSAERYQLAGKGHETQKFLSANPEIALFQNFTTVQNQNVREE